MQNDSKPGSPSSHEQPATRLVHSGRNEGDLVPFVNPPVVHASTVLFPDLQTMQKGAQRWSYGRRGTPTSVALDGALCELEGAAQSWVTPSGLAACTVALLALASTGDHVLITDSVYGPTRHFAERTLTRLGIEVEFYDPAAGADITALFKPNTRVVYLESPGSLTFDMQDVPAIAAATRAHGAFSIIDNTWATPLFFRPLEHGVDVVVHAGTKYIVGHSDAMMGVISANDRARRPIHRLYGDMGLCVGPDDMYLALRGLRTLDVRLRQHQKAALTLARWLETQPLVKRVLHPALPSAPGHEIWKRDYTGSSGLFAFVLQEAPQKSVHAMLDGLKLFGLGYSWGGFESLATFPDLRGIRTATRWEESGNLIRVHAGLEAEEDLLADLAAGLSRYAATSNLG